MFVSQILVKYCFMCKKKINKNLKQKNIKQMVLSRIYLFNLFD